MNNLQNSIIHMMDVCSWNHDYDNPCKDCECTYLCEDIPGKPMDYSDCYEIEEELNKTKGVNKNDT